MKYSSGVINWKVNKLLLQQYTPGSPYNLPRRRQMTYCKKVLLITFLTTILISPNAFGNNAIERMKGRVFQIEHLKKMGEAVELKTGYLKVMSNDPNKKRLIEAENADRMEVYTKIAKEKGVSVEFVGQRRAASIRKRDETASTKPLKGVPTNVSNIIIRKCTEKWPDNFRMQKYCRDEEAKAWLDMN